MKPARVPDDLIEAGFDAIRAWYAAHPGPNSYLDDRTQMRIVLAAALTVHNEQVKQPLRERAEAAEHKLAELGDEYANLEAESSRIASRAGEYRKELGELRERIGKSETPDSHCPWCGTPVRLDLDGLVPSHEHPTYFDECPGTHRRPSPEGTEDPSWTDHGDGWKSRRSTLGDFQCPFTGLLGPLGLRGDDGIGGEERA